MKHLVAKIAVFTAVLLGFEANFAAAQAPASECAQESKDRYGAAYLVKNGSKDAPGVKEPKRKHSVQVDLPNPLPQECRRPLSIHEALVGPSGKVERVWSLKTPCPQVDRAVVLAIKQWEYTPTLVDKQPVPICVTVSTLIHLR